MVSSRTEKKLRGAPVAHGAGAEEGSAVPASRRDEILAIAASIFARQGIASTTVRDIGEEAGILSGSLYHHFASKDDIVEEIIRAALDPDIELDVAVANSAVEPLDAVRQLLVRSLRFSHDHADVAAIIANSRHELLAAERFDFLAPQRHHQASWIAVLEPGMAHGVFRDLDPDLTYRPSWVRSRPCRTGTASGPRSIEDIAGCSCTSSSAGSAPTAALIRVMRVIRVVRVNGDRHALGGKVALVTGGGRASAASPALFRREGAEVVIPAADPSLGAVASATRSSVARRRRLGCRRGGRGGAGTGSLRWPRRGRGECRQRAVAVRRDRRRRLGDGDPQQLTTAFVTCRESLPALLERHGAIVIVSSLAGHFAGPGVVGYTTAKHGLIGLTRSLARDYGPQGVRVNAVSPAWVRSPMADRAMQAVGAMHGVDQDGAYALVTSQVPLRRPGEPEEVATICLFLATPDSALLMGAVLIDGGARVDLPTLALDGARSAY